MPAIPVIRPGDSTPSGLPQIQPDSRALSSAAAAMRFASVSPAALDQRTRRGEQYIGITEVAVAERVIPRESFRSGRQGASDLLAQFFTSGRRANGLAQCRARHGTTRWRSRRPSCHADQANCDAPRRRASARR